MWRRKTKDVSQENKRAVHIKTGKLYTVIHDDVVECTNGREELHYVVYTDGSMLFCREREEFMRKFLPYFDDFVHKN